MYKIYGSKMSTAARCMWLMEELGQPYESIKLDFATGENKSEAYLKLNPNGKVPTLVDGEFVIWESSAINAYLVEKHQPELAGSTIEERALVQQWSYWAIANIAPAFEPLYMMLFRGLPESEETKAAPDKIKRFVKVLDGALEGKEYLVGGRFTLADLNVCTIVQGTMHCKIDISEFTNVTRWMTALQSRDAAKKLA